MFGLVHACEYIPADGSVKCADECRSAPRCSRFLKKPRAAERLGRWTLLYKQHTALPESVTLVLTTSYYGKYDILS